MLKVVLTIDCERFISFKQGNPRWNKLEKLKGKLNNLIKNFRYNKKGFEIVKETLLTEKFPATLMLVGKIFDKPKFPSFLEIGYHTLNHLPLTLISDKNLSKEIENKWNVKSFTAPMWMIEDIKNPARIFKLLKKEGYSHCVYRGKNDGIKHFHANKIQPSIKKFGITCVNVSDFFEGNWNKKKILSVKKNLLKNLDKKGIYLLTTHDFTHKNDKILLNMVKFLKRLEKEKKIKILRLKDIK